MLYPWETGVRGWVPRIAVGGVGAAAWESRSTTLNRAAYKERGKMMVADAAPQTTRAAAKPSCNLSQLKFKLLRATGDPQTAGVPAMRCLTGIFTNPALSTTTRNLIFPDRFLNPSR